MGGISTGNSDCSLNCNNVLVSALKWDDPTAAGLITSVFGDCGSSMEWVVVDYTGGSMGWVAIVSVLVLSNSIVDVDVVVVVVVVYLDLKLPLVAGVDASYFMVVCTYYSCY